MLGTKEITKQAKLLNADIEEYKNLIDAILDLPDNRGYEIITLYIRLAKNILYAVDKLFEQERNSW